jgi:hypothetical protein
MSISDRTRKALWARSGNRCSICKIELFADSKKADKFNIGEECHIISSKTDGPRHRSDFIDYESYNNLILLCRNHHREIDELSDTYTEEILRYIKANHENWVQRTINKALDSEKKNKPRFLTRITSGKELFNIVSGCYGSRFDYDSLDNEEEAEYVGSMLQNMFDYGEIGDSADTYDKVKMGYQLNEILKDLDEKGYYVFGERYIERIKFNDGKLDNWPIATLIIKKKDSSEIIKLDLEP